MHINPLLHHLTVDGWRHQPFLCREASMDYDSALETPSRVVQGRVPGKDF